MKHYKNPSKLELTPLITDNNNTIQVNPKAVPYNVLMPIKAKGIQQVSKSVKKNEEYKASYVDKNLIVSQIKLKE